jgi:hypothetical protein
MAVVASAAASTATEEIPGSCDEVATAGDLGEEEVELCKIARKEVKQNKIDTVLSDLT